MDLNEPVLEGNPKKDEEILEKYKKNLAEYWDDLVDNEYFRDVAQTILSDYTTFNSTHKNPDDESTRKGKVHWWSDKVEKVIPLILSLTLLIFSVA